MDKFEIKTGMKVLLKTKEQAWTYPRPLSKYMGKIVTVTSVVESDCGACYFTMEELEG